MQIVKTVKRKPAGSKIVFRNPKGAYYQKGKNYSVLYFILKRK